MEEKNKMDANYDSLRGWREEITKYAGGTEEDATAEAIRAYMKQEEAKKKAEEDKNKEPKGNVPTPSQEDNELSL